MYKVFFTKRFEKQIGKFPKKEQSRILAKIESLLNNPRQNSLKLEGTKPPIYRLRVGEYRIFFVLDDTVKMIKATDVLRRTTQTYK